MIDLDKWCTDFKNLVPINENELTPNEATFYGLQAVSYMIDKIVNIGCKEVLVKKEVNKNEKESKIAWCDINELCKRHPELRKSNVISRKWRLENNFPCKGGYKCHQMYFEPDVVEWINQHLRRKKS